MPIGLNEGILARLLGQAESLCSYETLQFEDYGRMVLEYFDLAGRLERRTTVSPEDCDKAFAPGVRLLNGQPPPAKETL